MQSGNKPLSIILLVVCFAAVAACAVFAGYTFGKSSVQVDTVPAAALLTDKPTAPEVIILDPPVTNDSISVPGFERLTMRGQTLHADNIYNPVRNNCYFIVVVTLADGTEVYRSGILAPGQTVGNVELKNLLAVGIYEGAVAQYSSYAIDNLSPLNGADIDFILEVLP